VSEAATKEYEIEKVSASFKLKSRFESIKFQIQLKIGSESNKRKVGIDNV
jgi:hypothetical protein